MADKIDDTLETPTRERIDEMLAELGDSPAERALLLEILNQK